MILVINSSAGIPLQKLVNFLIFKLQNISVGDYQLVFTPDNSGYNFYKRRFSKLTRETLDPTYFTEENTDKINQLISNLYKNTYFVNFEISGVDLYDAQFTASETGLIENINEELENISNAYSNKTTDNFIIYGAISPILLNKIESKFGNIEFLNICRNPSIAWVYNNPNYYYQYFENLITETVNENVADIAFKDTYNLKDWYPEFDVEKLTNERNLINFIQTYVNVLKLRDAGYEITMLENLSNLRTRLCNKFVNFGLFFKSTGTYTYSCDIGERFYDLDVFNDLFSHIRYKNKFVDLFRLLGYSPLTESEISNS